MDDVARLAGVSKQTVSRVLNDNPAVRAETRESVLEAMRSLGYRPSRSARSLASGRTRMLGVISFDAARYGPASTLTAINTPPRRPVTWSAPSPSTPPTGTRSSRPWTGCRRRAPTVSSPSPRSGGRQGAGGGRTSTSPSS